MLNYTVKNLSKSGFFLGGSNSKNLQKNIVPFLFCSRNSFYIIDVLEFIGKLTQHIHQKGFRVIRRYGFFTCISVSPFCSICNLVYNNIQITLFNNKFTHRYIFFA